MDSKGVTVWTLILTLSLVQLGSGANPCCSYPCMNHGVCMTKADNYYCDCTNLDFYGKHCETPTLMKRIKLWLKPNSETIHNIMVNYKWFWSIVNNVSFLKNRVMTYVMTSRSDMIDSPPTHTSEHEYITLDAQYNYSVYTRTLPPVPKNCPTPMGVWGKKVLPPAEEIVKTFFVRKEFRPDPLGSTALFAYFAQHFTHQFFKTDVKKGPQFQWGGHGVDLAHIYGKDKDSEYLLRSFKDGKMKMQVIDGEEWPPYTSAAPVRMSYPANIPKDRRFAIGHEFFGLLPGLFMYGTIWLREHNRVCDILKQEHPEWDDERLYQTTKLICTGETIKIVIEDYVQHLSNYNFKLMFRPEFLFGEQFQYQNRIAVEFNHLYHWHPLMPSEFDINGTMYNVKEFMFHPEIVLKHGMREFVDSLSRQRAGAMGPRNHADLTLPVVTELIKHGRTLRLQSFNQYRKAFNMKMLKSFQELTGETKLAKLLEEAYGDIDGLEFYVGLLLEKRRPKALFGSSIVEMGAPYSIKGLLANPICSPKYWKPSTFGGDVGFDIVNTATIKKLFCQNIKGECPLVSFKVPDFVEGDVDDILKKTEL